MSSFKDLSGQVFGRLTVLERTGTAKSGHAIYAVQCDCEKKTVFNVNSNDLKKGHTKSCGCKRKPHGLSQSRLYRAWQNMKNRCDRETDISYKNYGERGITYTNEWGEFIPFRDWALSNGYEEDLTLERINVNGNYEPSNCTWVPMSEQSKNKRTNVHISYKGETKVLKDWAKHFDVPYSSIIGWYEKGVIEEKFDDLLKGIKYSKEEARYITYKSEKKKREEWAEYFNISLGSITHWKREGILHEKFDDLSKGINLNREQVLITYRGETKNVAGWLKHFNISKNTLMSWRQKEIVEQKFDDLTNGIGTAAKNPVLISYNGEVKNLGGWAKHFNISRRTISTWNKNGIVQEKFDGLSNGKLDITKGVLIEYKGITKNISEWTNYFNLGTGTINDWVKKEIVQQKFDELSQGIRGKKETLITYNNETKNINEWATHFHKSRATIRNWLKEGILEQKFDNLIQNNDKTYITHLNEIKTVNEWATHFGIAPNTIYNWRRKGLVEEKFSDLTNGKALKRHVPILITYKGVTKNQKEWARYFNIDEKAVGRWNKQNIIEQKFDSLTNQRNE